MMETPPDTPPSPRPSHGCLIAALIGIGIIVAGIVLFPAALYFYAYVLNGTTG